MSLPDINQKSLFHFDVSEEENDENEVKKINLLRHVKRKAANDAQLLM